MDDKIRVLAVVDEMVHRGIQLHERFEEALRGQADMVLPDDTQLEVSDYKPEVLIVDFKCTQDMVEIMPVQRRSKGDRKRNRKYRWQD